MVAALYRKVPIGGDMEVAKRTREAGIKERVSNRKKDTAASSQKKMLIQRL
jgi:hypothetical protein